MARLDSKAQCVGRARSSQQEKQPNEESFKPRTEGKESCRVCRFWIGTYPSQGGHLIEPKRRQVEHVLVLNY
jgi:hypothetical protein